MSSPRPDWSADAIVGHLLSLASPANLEGMARFGIATEKALGIPNAVLRPLARKIKRDHRRAGELWSTGLREARLLAIFSDNPAEVTVGQAREWAAEFNSWEIVDHAACLLVDAGLADDLIPEFAEDNREFVRRTAFAMIAWGAVHLKKRPDDEILQWLAPIRRHAGDRRNFVRKAINWALRQVGKRSLACHGPALALAELLASSDDKAERWVGNGAVKELTSTKVLGRLRVKAEKQKIK